MSVSSAVVFFINFGSMSGAKAINLVTSSLIISLNI